MNKMDLIIIKTTVLSIIFGTNLLLGLLTLQLSVHKHSAKSGVKGNCFTKYRILSFLNCIAGGVFLAATFLHLIPNTREGFVDTSLDLIQNFPVTEFTVAVGFLLSVGIEHVIFSISNVCARISIPSSNKNQKSKVDAYQLDTNEEVSQSSTTEFQPLLANEQHNEHKMPNVRIIALFIAISIHSLFEGLTLGLLKSITATWSLFLAVIPHKAIVTFSLSIQLNEKIKALSKRIASVCLFSLVSPIGILLGMYLTENNMEEKMAMKLSSAIIQGFASGTFLHITFFEILNKEIGTDHNLLRVLAVVIGFAFISLLTVIYQE